MKGLRLPVSLLLLFAICISLSSCSLFGTNYEKYAAALAADKREVSYRDARDEDYVEFLSELTEFSAAISDRLYKSFGTDALVSAENMCFSPLSVYMTLALAVECSKGETRKELLTALDMSYEEVRDFTSVLYAFCNSEFTYETPLGNKKVSGFEKLTASVWIDKSIGIEMDTARNLANNYNSDIFSVSFQSGEAERVIADYIEDKTNGLIDGDLNLDKERIVAVLLSTLYVKELWNDLGKKLTKTDEKYSFKNADGSKTDKYFLKSYYADGKIYEGENFKSFFASTAHGMKLHFILPDDGVSLFDAFSSDNLEEVLKLEDYKAVDDERMELNHTRVYFPEFEAEFDEDISGVLRQDFGIEKLFDEELCDLSFISTDKIWCDEVIHRTSLRVDALGIEGAAITAAAMAGSAGPPPYKDVYHDFVVDRAFGFILTDSYGTVLFSGVVNNVE